MQAVQQAMARLGVDMKDGIVLEILAAKRDFYEQKGRLQEEIEARGYKVIFFSKFHCGLNPVGPSGAKLSGIPESTVTAVLKDYVKLFLKH